jgi:hypothetical protein
LLQLLWVFLLLLMLSFCLFLTVLEFELKALHLIGRHSTSQAGPPAPVFISAFLFVCVSVQAVCVFSTGRQKRPRPPWSPGDTTKGRWEGGDLPPPSLLEPSLSCHSCSSTACSLIAQGQCPSLGPVLVAACLLLHHLFST